MLDKRRKVGSWDEEDPRGEAGDRVGESIDPPKRLVELEYLFGSRWMERYRRRPLVDVVFGTGKRRLGRSG